MRGYVVIADMTRTQRLRKLLPDDVRVISERECGVGDLGKTLMLTKRKPVAFVYNTTILSDIRVLIDLERPPDIPFIVLGSLDTDQQLVDFFGGHDGKPSENDTTSDC